MNHALTLRPPAPLPIARLLLIGAALWLTSAVGLAPTLARVASAATHSQVCKCTHCPGGRFCCCRLALKCPTP